MRKFLRDLGSMFASRLTKRVRRQTTKSMMHIVGCESLEGRVLLAGVNDLGEPAPAETGGIFDPPIFIDDGDIGYTTVGPWTTSLNPDGRDGDVRNQAAGDGSSISRWEFTGLESGNYLVSATWVAHPNRATNSPFTIRDAIGGTNLHSSHINQRMAPDDFDDDGSDWENLSIVTITGGTLVVDLTNDANGYVIADAIRIETTIFHPPLSPHIVDDGDPGFATVGAWNLTPLANGRENDLQNHVAGTGSDTATWTFTGLHSWHQYLVSATWFEHPNRATNSPFTIFDGTGGPMLDTVLINQKEAPNDFTDLGSDWEQLAVVTITGTELVVQLTDDANGYVIADAIHIQLVDQFPGRVIDNGDAGFSATAGWTPSPVSNGYEDDLLNAPTGDGSTIATWTFAGLVPGAYRVSTTWFAHPNRATDAPYTIYDGATPLVTIDLNQELAPDDATAFLGDWEFLDAVLIHSGTLTVELTNDANEFVIADAVRIERLDTI